MERVSVLHTLGIGAVLLAAMGLFYWSGRALSERQQNDGRPR